MSAASSFASIARTSTALSAKPTVTYNVPRVTFGGQQTIMKQCQGCGEQMPHVVGAKVCILCDGDEQQPATQREDDDSG